MLQSLEDSKVVLFGAGQNGNNMLKKLIGRGIVPADFVDNNPNIVIVNMPTGGSDAHISVKTPEVLLTEDKQSLKIIISASNSEELKTQIMEMGLGEYLYCNSEEKNLPDFVRIEASTLCQLNCSSCYMRQSKSVTTQLVGKGYLKFSDFKNFIDNHTYIKTIELSNNGEIFLNPELIDIIEYAFERNVILTANNGVNFNTVTDKMIETLVQYRFYSMTLSIDGASQEVYSIYRRNGDFDRVIENLKKLNEQKQKYDSEFPKLRWQYILMEHNEDDVINAKEKAKQLNMDIYFKLTWDRHYKPQKIDMLRAETGLSFLTRTEDELNTPSKISSYAPCHQLWKSPQINWDGRLLGCCCALDRDFGVNVFEEGLEKAINAENYRYAKLMLQGKAPFSSLVSKNIPCLNCHHYKKMLENNYFIEM